MVPLREEAVSYERGIHVRPSCPRPSFLVVSQPSDLADSRAQDRHAGVPRSSEPSTPLALGVGLLQVLNCWCAAPPVPV
jgi:hypothetical protein